MRALPFCVAPAMVVLVGVAFAAGPPCSRTDAYGDPLPEGALLRLGTARFREEFGGRSTMLSPDGKLLALAGSDGIRLLDAATGKTVRRIEVPGMNFGWDAAQFSPDWKLVAVSDISKAVICDVGRGVMVSKIDAEANDRWVFQSFSQDGKMLAVAGVGSLETPFVLLWDVAARKRVKTFSVPGNWGFALALSPDGKVLAAWDSVFRHGGKPPILQLWDTASGKKLHTFKPDAHSIDGAVFSPDGKRLVVSTNGSILSVHEVATGACLTRFAGRRGVGAVLRYSSDGKLLAAGSRDGVVQLWDPATGKRIGQCKGPPRTRLSSIAFLPGNKVLASGQSGLAGRIWEVPSGRERTPVGGHDSAVTTLAFSRDGKTLLSGGADGVRLWLTATGKEVRRIEARRDEWLPNFGSPVYLLSPDGRYLVGGVRNNCGFRAVDTTSGEEVAELSGYSDYNGTWAAFAADGAGFASLGQDHRGKTWVRVWNLAAGRETWKIALPSRPQGPYVRLALSRGAKVLAVCTSENRTTDAGQLTLWDLASGKAIAKHGIRGGNPPLAFSPDGALLVTTGDNGAIRFLEAASGSEVNALEGVKGSAPSLFAFSSDGRTLAVVSRGPMSEKVLLLELASGKVRAEFAGHGVQAMAFSRDGRILATGGSDTTVTLWDAVGLGARRKEKLQPADLPALWADLDSPDAAKAYRAMARLTAAPVQTLALLKKELKPAAGKPLAEKEVRGLIGELADDSFEGREKAGKALKTGGRFLRPALLAALQASTNLEQKRRLRELLRGLVASRPGPEMLRPTRALEVLEQLSTREARRLVETLAKGNPAARLTEDAAATLKRMTRTP